MKKYLFVLISIVIIVGIAGCAGANPMRVDTPDVAGFWSGLWDGFIAWFSLVASLFGYEGNIYEVANNGGWYNFGFLLGIGAFAGGGCGGTGRCNFRKSC